MSGKKETYVYGSLKERFALEWKIYALAFGFILIADNIGQIKIPVGKGMFILFPVLRAQRTMLYSRAREWLSLKAIR